MVWGLVPHKGGLCLLSWLWGWWGLPWIQSVGHRVDLSLRSDDREGDIFPKIIRMGFYDFFHPVFNKCMCGIILSETYFLYNKVLCGRRQIASLYFQPLAATQIYPKDLTLWWTIKLSLVSSQKWTSLWIAWTASVTWATQSATWNRTLCQRLIYLQRLIQFGKLMDYYFINSTTCPRFPQMVNPSRNSFARNNSEFHGFCSASMQDLCLLQISPLDPLTPGDPVAQPHPPFTSKDTRYIGGGTEMSDFRVRAEGAAFLQTEVLTESVVSLLSPHLSTGSVWCPLWAQVLWVAGSLCPGSSGLHRKVTRLAFPSILCHPLSSEPWNSTVFIAVSRSISLFVACAIENCHQGSELILGWEKRQETDTFPSSSPGSFTLQPSPSTFNYSRVHLELGSDSACLPSNHKTYPDTPESSPWIQNKLSAL